MNADRINALACAISVLDGSGDGFSADEKYAAKQELMKALAEEEHKE